MGGLDELAARLRRAAGVIENDGALRVARAAGGAFLGQLKDNTPVESGALRDSESMSVSGGGLRATATIGTHLPLYASFRETGGDIFPHDRSRGGWVGSPRVINGIRYGHHTLHWGGEPGVFAMHVHQEGSWYMRRTVEWAEGGGLDGPARTAVDRIMRDAGL